MNRMTHGGGLMLVLILLTAASLHAQNDKGVHGRDTIRSGKAEPKVFVVLDVTVHDSALYEQYRTAVEPVIKKYGGRYLVRSGAKSFDQHPDTRLIEGEGKWAPDRLIITQWESMEQFQTFVKSEEYVEVAKLRANSATSKSVIVKEYLNP
ncbi:MAG: DUF1330 domain-containing protein [Bacteroidia bacterium]|nr:DUF1330 domain-containing protein [Bacteroidia bacterium]